MEKEKIEVGENGRLYIVKGRRRMLKWTPQMLSDLRRFYPTTSNHEMEEILGIRWTVISNKAYKMGIHKSAEYLLRIRREHAMEMGIGNHGIRPKISPQHRERINEGIRRWAERIRNNEGCVHPRSIPIYCAEDKTTYPSMRHFLEAKGMKFDKYAYDKMQRDGNYRGYTLMRMNKPDYKQLKKKSKV